MKIKLNNIKVIDVHSRETGMDYYCNWCGKLMKAGRTVFYTVDIKEIYMKEFCSTVHVKNAAKANL